MFQSTPGFLAGRNSQLAGAEFLRKPFQSTPGFLAGRNVKVPDPLGGDPMFQSTPGFLAGRNFAFFILRASIPFVSIHSRLFGREKPSSDGCGQRDLLFQSTPGFLAGRNHRAGSISTSRSRFNPLPAFWPGETRASIIGAHGVEVSIHSRLFGREKLKNAQKKFATRKFQSTPGFLAGRNDPGQFRWIQQQPVSIHSRLFGREKLDAATRPYRRQNVSIHSRLFGREKPLTYDPAQSAETVSIHSRLFGREKLFLRGRSAACRPRFNPLPAFWPGETWPRISVIRHWKVSIHSRLFGREKPFTLSAMVWREGFQSTPGFLAGRNSVPVNSTPLVEVVSIHSRLFGREKR